MGKTFKCNFELFDVKVRRLQNGHKLRLVLEKSYELDLEKALIEFRGENVRCNIKHAVPPENKKDNIEIETIFEVFEVKFRGLRNGDKQSLVLECLYDKPLEIDCVKMRYNEVEINMETEQQELDFNGEEEVIEVEQ